MARPSIFWYDVGTVERTGPHATATRAPEPAPRRAGTASWWARAFSDESENARVRGEQPENVQVSAGPPADFRRPARPVATVRLGRWLLLAVFWAGLAAAVLPWWTHTSPRSLHGTPAVLTAGARVTGLVGGYVLLVQVLLMSRSRRLDRWIGGTRLLVWHRELGGFLVVTVLAHSSLVVVGYAATDRVGVTSEVVTLLTTYHDMVSAVVATGILTGIGVLGIRGLRRVLPHEVWYLLHLATYLILLLAYGHQFANGHELAEPGPARYYWTGLYVLAVGAVGWQRVLAPVAVNLRHRMRVLRVVPEAPGTVSVYVTGRRLDALGARAGQYLRWRFLTSPRWWQSHPFSLSAAPNGQWLRLTAKAVGRYTADLDRLRAGTRVLIGGPAGEFTADRRTRPRALLIAGGSGIAPIRALLEELPPRPVVIYRASHPDDVAFRQELDWLAQARGADIWYVTGSRDDPGPRRLFTVDGLRELVPDVVDRDVYVCGPPGLVTLTVRLLRVLRVPRRQVHLDPFEF